jgi:FdhD protein
MNDNLPIGARPKIYRHLERGASKEIGGAVIEEAAICIHVNGKDFATIMATPIDQKAMALGFLRAEGFIAGLGDVELAEVHANGACVDVWVKHDVERPNRLIRTTGCGGGITFDDLTAKREPLPFGDPVTARQIIALYTQLSSTAVLYPITRGVHTSGLCTADEILIWTEDVGRHNTLDKLWGKAMLADIPTAGRIIVTTGRISSEMLGKAAKMGVPIIASRTSPTSRSLALAEAWNITVAGYVRRASLRVYTHPDRITSV